MEINSKIDEIMETKQVTVDQLIEKTGLPRMTIFNARTGANVTMKTALRISEALEVPLHDIWSVDSLERDEELADVSSS